MKLGFLTACMPERSLEDIAAWAGAHGYEALELAAWPGEGNRPFVASHLADDAGEHPGPRHGLGCSALAYYDNNLHPDPAERERDPRAPAHGASTRPRGSACPVGTFIGRDPAKSVAENLREAERSSRRSSTTPASAA